MSDQSHYRANQQDVFLHLLKALQVGSEVRYISRPKIALFSCQSHVLVDDRLITIRRVLHAEGLMALTPNVYWLKGVYKIRFRGPYSAAHVAHSKFDSDNKDTIIYSVKEQ